jgi:hypothetical protein
MCERWVSETQWISALSGGILSICHPEQYELGRASLLEMLNRPDVVRDVNHVARALSMWSSPFNGISVMINHITPIHRDTQGRFPWMDLLVTAGPYSDCRMELRSLGVRLAYDSGTAVAVCGKVVPHAVSDCDGERACIAYYMRDNVQARLGLPAGTWTDIHTI